MPSLCSCLWAWHCWGSRRNLFEERPRNWSSGKNIYIYKWHWKKDSSWKVWPPRFPSSCPWHGKVWPFGKVVDVFMPHQPSSGWRRSHVVIINQNIPKLLQDIRQIWSLTARDPNSFLLASFAGATGRGVASAGATLTEANSRRNCILRLLARHSKKPSGPSYEIKGLDAPPLQMEANGRQFDHVRRPTPLALLHS